MTWAAEEDRSLHRRKLHPEQWNTFIPPEVLQLILSYVSPEIRQHFRHCLSEQQTKHLVAFSKVFRNFEILEKALIAGDRPFILGEDVPAFYNGETRDMNLILFILDKSGDLLYCNNAE